MQKIESLLKNIVNQKDDTSKVVEIIQRVTSIQIERKDVCMVLYKGVKKIKLNISGVKKTKLALYVGELSKEFLKEGFTLVL